MSIERVGDHKIDLPPQIDLVKPAAPDLANQFEAVYLQSMLESSCIEQHFTDNPSPFSIPCQSRVLHESLDTRAIASENKQPVIAHTDVPQTVDDFVKSIWPYAKQASNLIGLDPKVLMAQAALETGWGQFIAKDTDGSSSHNLFNIKARGIDPSVNIKTTEYVADAPMSMMALFKKYSSVADSFNDYVSLIEGARYKQALANTADPKRYIDAIHQAGYATDPDYAHKILSIYHGDELQRALERNGCI